MAFPSNIKSSGVLSQTNDMFEYFRGGLLELSSATTNREGWPLRNIFSGGMQFFNDQEETISLGDDSTYTIIGSNTILPISRGGLYEYFSKYDQTKRAAPHPIYGDSDAGLFNVDISNQNV